MDQYIIEEWNEAPEEVASDTMQYGIHPKSKFSKKINVARILEPALVYNS